MASKTKVEYEVEATGSRMEGGATVESYHVRKPGGEWHVVQVCQDDPDNWRYPRCDCKGFQFNKTCSHIGAVEADIAETDEW